MAHLIQKSLKLWLVLLFVFLYFFSTALSDTYAQSCGNYTITEVVGCTQDRTTGACSPQTSTSIRGCTLSGSTCMGQTSSSTCDSGCNFVQQSNVNIPCGSTAGGGCPSECRAGSSCGAGYSGASGCSGCKSTQVCCKANSCGSTGGGGGCPCGQENLHECKGAGNCGGGSTGGVCGTDTKGNDKYWCDYTRCVTCPVCTATAPTNLVVTQISPNIARLNWTLGASGTSQSVHIGTNLADVNGNCTATGHTCDVNTIIAATDTSYTTPPVLMPGKIYYYKVVNRNSSTATCAVGSIVVSKLSSCAITPNPVSLSVGQTALLTTDIDTSAVSSIQRVDFQSSNTSAITVAPASDTTNQYQTVATSVAGGSSTISATVYSTAGAILCQTGSASYPGSTSTTVTSISTTPWWQVKDGDVTTLANLTSLVPTASYFDTVGNGGFPGVPVFGTTFNLSTDQTKISTNKWNANTATTESRIFDYAYFKNLIPSDIVFASGSSLATPQTTQHGYEWFRTVGDLTLGSNIDLGTRKVILFVENGNLSINGNINLTDNQGFFGAIVDNNINVGASVTSATGPALEGLYLSDLAFNTGAGTGQLHLRGSVVAYGGISLVRNLANNTLPAELFEFAPDQIILFPDKLGYRRQKWLEVSP